MGIYINPPDRTKEEWLEEFGERLSAPPTWPPPTGKAIVCLIHNQFFTAAGVCYSMGELRGFTYPHDVRRKDWFYVPLPALRTVLTEQEMNDIDLH